MPTSSNAALVKHWAVIRSHLESARQALPEPIRENLGQLRDADLAGLATYGEFIDHNELELALDQLEALGDVNDCRGGFWRDLQRAATLMELTERAQRLDLKFHEALTRTGRAT